MPGIHGSLGTREWYEYWEHDDGCEFSEGAACKACPFIECREILHPLEKRQFLREWNLNRAIRRRRLMWQVASAYENTQMLDSLLAHGWEPFAASGSQIWLRKPPLPGQQPQAINEEKQEQENAGAEAQKA